MQTEQGIFNADSGVRQALHLSALVARMTGGDQTALSELYDRLNRQVFGLALRIVSVPADAEEVTLDVFSQAWRQAGRYDSARGDVVSWLLTLTHSRAIDRLRSRASARKREESLDAVSQAAAPGDDPETATSLSERARKVRGALSALVSEQREVIELAYFEGLTHVEIARKLSEPLGTVKSRIRLGMAKLRDTLCPAPEGWSM